MRAPLIGILAGLAAVGSPLHPAVAQDGASTIIGGFNGLDWGASAADIEAKHGAPQQVDTLENDLVVLAYEDTLLDRRAITLYAVREGQGLIKGQHMVQLDLEAGDCEGQYRQYRDLVTLRYPLISPIEDYDYPFTMTFCEAVEAQNGTWATQWRDEATGAVATVIVEDATDVVKLIYESRAFREWSEGATEDGAPQ